ncbi:ribokinase [Desulforamulus ferrireducens]|uniref:Ribokinase n=1 Tax=Desulforamulus ferrireducens TaxID=1833852 RepID=A0A1S6IYV4_9FIRM|nr:ribokinase [Desulforamulus ferrireducens]AQS59940.1 ribokinase [Desulforamulus ferrireducens]
MTTARVLVVGSINMDLVSYSERIPGVGETVLGKRFLTVPGGKGANQAVAAARLGAQVTMLGAAGTDSHGEQLLKHLQQTGIDISHIKQVDTSTGVALINVDSKGNNQIVVVPGANFAITPADLEAREQVFANADVVVLQLEIPLDTIGKAIDLANKYQKPVILNPAPAQPLPEEWFAKVDYLIPNEHEALLLGGSPEDGYLALRSKVKQNLLVTKGEQGVFYATGETAEVIPAFKVKAVDTTAAGDAFIGGFSVALAEGKNLKAAIIFASAVAALSVGKEGAQTSLPARTEVEQFIGGCEL